MDKYLHYCNKKNGIKPPLSKLWVGRCASKGALSQNTYCVLLASFASFAVHSHCRLLYNHSIFVLTYYWALYFFASPSAFFENKLKLKFFRIPDEAENDMMGIEKIYIRKLFNAFHKLRWM